MFTRFFCAQGKVKVKNESYFSPLDVSLVLLVFSTLGNISIFLYIRQQVFEENLNKVQAKLDDVKKSQAQCEETIRLKTKLMVMKHF